MNQIQKIVAMNVVLWGFVFLCVVFVWCLTQVGRNEHGLSLLVICVGLLAALLLAVIVVVPFWVILKRLGTHPALSILMLVPLANLVTLYMVAFSKSNSGVAHAPSE
jgi:apolipoprotein N-acyltransferase